MRGFALIVMEYSAPPSFPSLFASKQLGNQAVSSFRKLPCIGPQLTRGRARGPSQSSGTPQCPLIGSFVTLDKILEDVFDE